MKVYLTVLITLIIAGKVYASPAIDFIFSNQTVVLNTSITDTTKSNAEIPDPDEFIPADIEPDGNDILKQISRYTVYPDEALRSNLEGAVTLQLLFNEEGQVIKVRHLSKTNEIFQSTAEAAAYKVKTRPAVFKGKTIKYWMVLPIRFTIQDQDKINLLGYRISNEKVFLDFISLELNKALMRKYSVASKKMVQGIVQVSLTLKIDGNIDDVVVLSTTSEYLGKVIPNMLEKVKVKSGIYPNNEDVRLTEVILNVKLPEED